MGEEIDPAFIQSPEHRPNFRFIEPEEIPVINLSSTNPNHTPKLISDIGNACKKWGFFQVINHGVSSEACRRIEEETKKFFHQPIEEKKKVKRDEVNSMGYHDGEHTKNVRDWKEVFDFLLEGTVVIPASHEFDDDEEVRVLSNQWPQFPNQFRSSCEEYAKEVEKLGFKLLELMALSLGLRANQLNSYFKDSTSFLRLNHYPSCPYPELALGVGRHKDAGALTILAQDDVGGLQVKNKADGEWIPVKPIPNAFIINVGDVMQVWSNGLYESAEHRVVVNSTNERFSIPFFLFPAHYVTVKPIEELSESETMKYKEYNWGKFFVSRNRSDYKKLHGENLQIDQFKVSS